MSKLKLKRMPIGNFDKDNVRRGCKRGDKYRVGNAISDFIRAPVCVCVSKLDLYRITD